MGSSIGVKVARLISKSVGNAVAAGKQVPFGKGRPPLIPPPGATTFDLIEGIGAKGKKYVSCIFKNKHGRTVSQTTRYSDGKEINIVNTVNKQINTLDTTITTNANGIKNVSHTSLCMAPQADGSTYLIKSFTNSGNK